MAEPVIVPVQLEVTDVDTSKVNWTDAEKQISTSMSNIKRAINDAFKGIDPSAINKPIEKTITNVERGLQSLEKAQLRVTEAMIKAGKSSKEYKDSVAQLDALIDNYKNTLAQYDSWGLSFTPEYAKTKKEFDDLVARRNKLNPIEFVDKAQPIELERVSRQRPCRNPPRLRGRSLQQTSGRYQDIRPHATYPPRGR